MTTRREPHPLTRLLLVTTTDGHTHLQPHPLQTLQLSLKGKSIIGSSPMSVHILISHRSPHPTFAEHSFRYLYESRPPHKRAGKFSLPKDRLHAACVELATNAGEANVSTVCQEQPLTLWVGFKCRAIAVSELSFIAKYK